MSKICTETNKFICVRVIFTHIESNNTVVGVNRSRHEWSLARVGALIARAENRFYVRS